jgi:hypothetical protein
MLLLDNSAWARPSSRSLPDERRVEIADLIEGGDVAVRAPFLLEAAGRRAAQRTETRSSLTCCNSRA